MPVRKIATVAGAAQPVTLAQAKAQCRADGTDEDTLISAYIDAAVQAAADRLQRTLVPTRYRLTLDSFPPAIELTMPPIMSVESVKYIDVNGTQQTLDPLDYVLDSVSEPGYLVPAVGRTWPVTQDRVNAVEVEYTAGYAGSVVPEPVAVWIMLAVADLYENRSRSAEKPVVPQHFADSLLEPYRIWEPLTVAMFPIADFSQRVTFEAEAATRNALNERVGGWAEAFKAWARVRPVSQRDNMGADQPHAVGTYIFTIRASAAGAATVASISAMRVRWKGGTYHVSGEPLQLDAGQYMQVRATSQKVNDA